MPLNLPDKLPAIDLLKEENIFVIDSSRASTQDIRPLKIVILNLMPIKITTETDLIRLLSNSPLQIEVSFMKLKSHTSKNTPIEHMKAFYRDFECMRNEKFDGMIITGAPVEHLEFEDVNYWDEIQDIFNWTRTHVTSTLYICWAAQAGLYYHYGVRKELLDEKIFGIFQHHTIHRKTPLIRGFDDVFNAPHSRHSQIVREDVEKNPELTILADSEEAGPFIIIAKEGRQIFVTGHPEYDVLTLDGEYKRDLAKGMDNVPFPNRYYKDDKPELGPVKSWRCHANTLYTNWLNYYVYQMTTYDPMEIQNLK